jgi:capsular exopolysaccharide synthesis family protein
MENMNDTLRNDETNSLKDYINLVKNNLMPFLLITGITLIVALIYAATARNIYKSTTSLKISKPQGSLLESSIMPDLQSFTDDRFISTEIEIMKSYTIRESVAKALIKNYNESGNKNNFYLILDHNEFSGKKQSKVLPVYKIAKMLSGDVQIEQKRGIDIVDISADSPSPYEAALIVNLYAAEYKKFNLQENRNQLTTVREFLGSQVKDKQKELEKAENELSSFQAKNGIIALDAQSQSLITQLANFEAQRDDVKIDLASTNKILSQLKDELSQQNPKVAAYLESLASQSYFQALQDGIAKLEVNKDIALSNKSPQFDNSKIAKNYDDQIKALKDKLNEKVNVIKQGMFASNPDEIKDLTQKILEAGVKEKSLRIQLKELNDLVHKYDSQFNKLPKTSIEYASLERNREAAEKLFSLLEQKFQEAQINELSQPGNVVIIDSGRIPEKPAKPHRLLIVLIGFIVGGGFAFGYVFVKNYFDNTIKTPEDIQNRNINVLSWIPNIEGLGVNGNKEYEFIVAKKPDAIPSEAFRALRTRVQFSKIGTEALKTILVTSSAPSEGKTTVCVNLAGTFAQSNKRTLILDGDLRKPRVHTVFNANRFPGAIDYLFGQAELEEIIRPTELKNLSYITAGTIPPNPSEMLGSEQMKMFLTEIKRKFDVILIDSAPIIAVTDSEILSTMVDATLLVVSAEVTELDLMEKSVELIKQSSSSFIGTVLNNFAYKSGYGSYYKYYYYYSSPTNGKGTKKPVKNTIKKS